MNETRVLIVGLDGGTFKNLKPWLDSNRLPRLSSIYHNGCHATLRTFFPTLSPLEWACFYTGKSPGKLGLFALSHVEDLKNPKGSWHFIDSSQINAKSLWKILSEQNIPVGVVNIPATYPVEQVHGFLISGYLTPTSSTDFYYPKSLEGFMKGYKIESDFEYLPDKNVDTTQLLAELRWIAERRTTAMIEIMNEIPVRFLAVNFKEIDTLQHVFWGNETALLDFFKFVDGQIGRLIDALKPTHVFIMSDHGFHEAESEYFYVNSWLRGKMLLVGAGGVKGKLWNFAFKSAMMLSKRSERIRSIVVARKESAAKYASLQIDLEKSQVYASQWGIFFNPESRISPGYKQLRDGLRAELLEMKSPTGQKVFEHVFTREELFQGEHLEKFPDLIPIPTSRFLVNPNLYTSNFDKRIDRPYLKGAHKSDPNAIFLLSGEGVKPDTDLGVVALTDIAPTTLFLFGLNPPSDMDGRIIEEAFLPDYITQTKSKQLITVSASDEMKERKAYTDEEQEQLMEQLRKLGYV